MITKNFKHLLALLLGSSGTSITTAYLPVKTVTNQPGYLGGNFNQFPYNVSKTVSFGNGPGILVGTGKTTPTEDDYFLESKISGGLTASIPTISYNADNGNPYTEYLFTLTNTTDTDIVISEIGYVQNLYYAYMIGSNASSTASFLLDHTILDTPVTVPANGSAAIKYRLKTEISS